MNDTDDNNNANDRRRWAQDEAGPWDFDADSGAAFQVSMLDPRQRRVFQAVRDYAAGRSLRISCDDEDGLPSTPAVMPSAAPLRE